MLLFLFGCGSGLIISTSVCVIFYRQRVRAVHYVMAPWLTCVVPPCCGVRVKGSCVPPPYVTWRHFARSSMHPDPSVLWASAHWPSPACHAATGRDNSDSQVGHIVSFYTLSRTRASIFPKTMCCCWHFLQPWRTSALGLPHLRTCPWTPRLGPEIWGRGGASRARWLHSPPRMSPVQDRGPLRAPVAGLRACCVRRRRSSHSRVCAMWPRLLREDSQVLGRDPATPRDSRFQTHLPLLLHCAQLPWLDSPHLPGPHWLDATTRQPLSQ